MKIVIDIPEKIYKEIVYEYDTFPYQMKNYGLSAIKNGTPLPKGHGRMIFEPTEEEIEKTIGGQNDFAECIRDCVKAVFENASTIIEADKEETDADSN